MAEAPTVARSELILGGQKSGKSRRAESLAAAWLAQAPAHRAVLIATAEALDDETARRQADQREALRTAGALRDRTKELEARLASARDALDQDDPEVARQMLTDAEGYVGQAEDEFGTSPRTAELRSQIAQERKAVERVAPLYGLTTPLIRFAPDAEPQQVMVAGQDIYVLDTGRNAVTAYRLTSDGEALADPAEGQVVLRSGDVVDGVTAGPLLDLAARAGEFIR